MLPSICNTILPDSINPYYTAPPKRSFLSKCGDMTEKSLNVCLEHAVKYRELGAVIATALFIPYMIYNEKLTTEDAIPTAGWTLLSAACVYGANQQYPKNKLTALSLLFLCGWALPKINPFKD